MNPDLDLPTEFAGNARGGGVDASLPAVGLGGGALLTQDC